jgi:hypothetical protein
MLRARHGWCIRRRVLRAAPNCRYPNSPEWSPRSQSARRIRRDQSAVGRLSEIRATKDLAPGPRRSLSPPAHAEPHDRLGDKSIAREGPPCYRMPGTRSSAWRLGRRPCWRPGSRPPGAAVVGATSARTRLPVLSCDSVRCEPRRARNDPGGSAICAIRASASLRERGGRSAYRSIRVGIQGPPRPDRIEN